MLLNNLIFFTGFQKIDDANKYPQKKTKDELSKLWQVALECAGLVRLEMSLYIRYVIFSMHQLSKRSKIQNVAMVGMSDGAANDTF